MHCCCYDCFIYGTIDYGERKNSSNVSFTYVDENLLHLAYIKPDFLVFHGRAQD